MSVNGYLFAHRAPLSRKEELQRGEWIPGFGTELGLLTVEQTVLDLLGAQRLPRLGEFCPAGVNLWTRTGSDSDPGLIRLVTVERAVRLRETPDAVVDFLTDRGILVSSKRPPQTLEVRTSGVLATANGSAGERWEDTRRFTYFGGRARPGESGAAPRIIPRRWEWPADLADPQSATEISQAFAAGVTGAHLLDLTPGEVAPFMVPGFRVEPLRTGHEFATILSAVAQQVAGNPADGVVERGERVTEGERLLQALWPAYTNTETGREVSDSVLLGRFAKTVEIVATPEAFLASARSARVNGPSLSCKVEFTSFNGDASSAPVTMGWTWFRGFNKSSSSQEGVWFVPWQSRSEGHRMLKEVLRHTDRQAHAIPGRSSSRTAASTRTTVPRATTGTSDVAGRAPR